MVEFELRVNSGEAPVRVTCERWLLRVVHSVVSTIIADRFPKQTVPMFSGLLRAATTLGVFVHVQSILSKCLNSFRNDSSASCLHRQTYPVSLLLTSTPCSSGSACAIQIGAAAIVVPASCFRNCLRVFVLSSPMLFCPWL